MPSGQGPRRRGLRLDPTAFEAEMVSRRLHGADLAKLAGVNEETLSRARRGYRVDRATMLRIVDALDKVPAHPLLSRMVARGPADVKSASGVRSRGAEEAGGDDTDVRRPA